jgi:hypothetical protein
MLTTMKKKTYHNFLIVRNKLMNEKGYDPKTASELTHRIFENLEANPSQTAKMFYDHILSKEEFEAQF